MKSLRCADDTIEGPLSWRTIFLLGVVLTMFYWLGTGRVTLYDRDEPRFAQPAKEILFAQSWKDWIVPHLNGEMHFHKPPLPYWQMALSFKVLGVSDFSARLFSGLWTALTAGVLARYLSQRFSKTAGLIGGLALGTSLMVVIEAKLCTADATLGFLTLLGVVCLWEIYRGADLRRHKLVLWLSAGAAILVKGPTVFLVLVGLIAVLLVIDKDRRWFLRTGFWWGLPLSLAVGLPWYIVANYLSDGALVERFVGYDLVRRAKMPVEGHRGFPGFYVLTGLIDTWPWSAFLAPAAIFAWRHRKDRDIKFLFAWLLGPTLILELMATKMVHYWLVILPAYIVLLAMMMDRWVCGPDEAEWRRWRKPVTICLSVVWGILAIGAMVGSLVYMGFIWQVAVLSAVLIVAAGLIVYAAYRREPMRFFWMTTLSAVLFGATVSVFVLPVFERYKIGSQAAHAMKSLGDADSSYALVRWQEETTIYYLHSGDRHVRIGGAKDFLKFYSQPNTVVGVEDREFDAVINMLPPELRNSLEFSTVQGLDYTRGLKPKTIYLVR
ncbi:MAG: glycosyltransferase family 39 protein, partial [Phycisphaerae bacterium]|nr:glycosyltransferase family 39 protein [Phycisphaerae bacterium]